MGLFWRSWTRINDIFNCWMLSVCMGRRGEGICNHSQPGDSRHRRSRSISPVRTQRWPVRSVPTAAAAAGPAPNPTSSSRVQPIPTSAPLFRRGEGGNKKCEPATTRHPWQLTTRSNTSCFRLDDAFRGQVERVGNVHTVIYLYLYLYFILGLYVLCVIFCVNFF